VARLPTPADGQGLSARQTINTPVGQFEVRLQADPHSTDASLGLLAGRLSLYISTILLAIVLTWAAIEQRIIHRITLLTRRAASLRHAADTAAGLQLELHGLRGSDELGLLAGVLSDLLQRIHQAARQEQLRMEQQQDMWHAVGHEIMAPLQSLSALHTEREDPSLRYVRRMRQAVRVLYGSASARDAFQSASLRLGRLDVQAFLCTIAHNAADAGIAGVQFEASPTQTSPTPVMVRADEYSLEDVITHVLSNANRYRYPGSPIQLSLCTDAAQAQVRIHNQGPCIALPLLGKVFEYGVSDQPAEESGSHRGQGLFVAKTYMAKMGGTIEAVNVADGVEFVLTLAVA
jgi:signal transduction histidine kinase